MKKALLMSALFALSLSASSASAAGPDPEKLFAEGTALMDQQKYEDALPKLLEAQKLDPGIGTQFNIGVCYEKLGKLGSAWRNYSDVLVHAKHAGKKQREDAAKQKLDELRPRVSSFVIQAKDGDVTVAVDGAALTKDDWAFYPVDPGAHDVLATAPSKKPWSAKVTAGPDAKKQEIVVPALEIERVTVTKETTNGRRTLGFVLGGVGVAGLVAAGVTGFMLLDAQSTADDDCTLPSETPDAKRCRTDDGRSAVSRGETLLPINAVAWGVGVVGLAAGTFFILTSSKKSDDKRAVAVLPSVGPSGGSVALLKRF